MATEHNERLVAITALLVIVATVGVSWQIADVRAAQIERKQVDDLVDTHVNARQAPADYDGDGIDDSTDRCPTRPETANGFQDSDGCPDVVATTGAS